MRRRRRGRRTAASWPNSYRGPLTQLRGRQCKRAKAGRGGAKGNRQPRRDDVAMTEVDRAITAKPDDWRPDEPGLRVGFADVLVALLSFASSLAVLAYGM